MVLGRSTLVFIWSLGFQVQYLSFPVQYQERDCGSWPSPRESSPHNSLLCNQQTPANTKPNTKAFIQIQKYQNTNRQTGTVSLHILLKECFDFYGFRWLMITALKNHCTQQLNIIIDLEGTFLKSGIFLGFSARLAAPDHHLFIWKSGKGGCGYRFKTTPF